MPQTLHRPRSLPRPEKRPRNHLTSIGPSRRASSDYFLDELRDVDRPARFTHRYSVSGATPTAIEAARTVDPRSTAASTACFCSRPCFCSAIPTPILECCDDHWNPPVMAPVMSATCAKRSGSACFRMRSHFSISTLSSESALDVSVVQPPIGSLHQPTGLLQRTRHRSQHRSSPGE